MNPCSKGSLFEVTPGFPIPNNKGPHFLLRVFKNMADRFQKQVMIFYRHEPADDADRDLIFGEVELSPEFFSFGLLVLLKSIEVKAQGHHMKFFFWCDAEVLHQFFFL